MKVASIFCAVLMGLAIPQTVLAAEPVGDPVNLSIAHIGALESPSNKAVEYFGELVSERSGGTITITNYPASQLGGDRDILEGIIGGSIDMGIPAAGISALFYPAYYIFDTPYLFESEEHLLKVSSGEIGERMAAGFEEANHVKVLAQNWERGTRQCIFRNEVTDLEGFKGVKIRLPEIDSYVKAFDLLGTKPTIIAFNDTYSSLQQGVADGMECPLDWIYDNKFYEVCKYLVITNHVYSVMTMIINENSFNNLSPEQQEIVQQAAIEAGEYENTLLHESEADYLQKMIDDGVTVSEPDINQFIDVVAPMLPELVNSWEDGLYEEVIAAAE